MLLRPRKDEEETSKRTHASSRKDAKQPRKEGFGSSIIKSTVVRASCTKITKFHFRSIYLYGEQICA